MSFTSVLINNNSRVQPGWIYLKEKNRFYLPKDKINSKIESSSCLIEVKELPLDELKKITGTVVNKTWQDDLRYLSKDQTFKMIYCLLSTSKEMKPLHQENIDFEYASEIYYGYGIMVMLKFNKKYEISLEKIQHILNQWMKGKTECNIVKKDAFENIHSVNIYYESFKKSPFYYLPSHAFHEIIGLFKFIKQNDNLESMKAIVRTLPPDVNNQSILMCSYDVQYRKSSRNQSFLRKLWDGVKNALSSEYEEVDLDKKSAVKVLVGIIDANKHLASVVNNNTDRLSKETVNAKNIGSDLQHEAENQSSSPDTIPPVNTDQKLINGKNIIGEDYRKPKSANQVSEELKAEYSYEAKTEPPKLEDKEAGTRSQVSSAPYNDSKASHKMADSANDESKNKNKKVHHSPKNAKKMMPVKKASNYISVNDCQASHKKGDAAYGKLSFKNKKGLDSPRATKGTPPVNLVELQPPRRSDEESGLSHHYYYERSKDTEEERCKKTLLLFGTDDSGKLSLLNLLHHCFQTEENERERPIFDIASKVKSISFYHFLSKGASEELIVIVTPELKCDVLASLKKLLSEGILNINALGFVANSRSETLTSEERSFFNFIRSSFGEVSNHHLMTFLTFCKFSRNFPILEEMKFQAIKSKCVLELNSFELGLGDTSETDALGSALITRELKKAKKVFKTLKDMPLLSVKSMKMAQEKSFAETHCASSLKQLVEELERFATLVENEKGISKTVEHIWRLATLVLTLEGGDSSERNLLCFVAKVLADSKGMESKMASRCFLLLLFNCPERNFTATLLSTLAYYFAITSSLNVTLNVSLTCSVIGEDNKISQYCNSCKDIHLCDRDVSDRKLLHVKCLICSCPAKSHSLWTFQDANKFSNSFCEMAVSVLKELCNDLPQKNFVIHFSLFLECLSKTFPKYGTFLRAITEPRK